MATFASTRDERSVLMPYKTATHEKPRVRFLEPQEWAGFLQAEVHPDPGKASRSRRGAERHRTPVGAFRVR